MSEEKNKFFLKKQFKSFIYAFQGLLYFFRTQHNAWIHLFAALLVIFFGFYFDLSNTEWCLIIVAIGFVFTAEILNASVEALVDLISPKYNKQAGRIKDLAAGAVLIAAITAAVIGIIVFLPKFYDWL